MTGLGRAVRECPSARWVGRTGDAAESGEPVPFFPWFLRGFEGLGGGAAGRGRCQKNERAGGECHGCVTSGEAF